MKFKIFKEDSIPFPVLADVIIASFNIAFMSPETITLGFRLLYNNCPQIERLTTIIIPLSLMIL